MPVHTEESNMNNKGYTREYTDITASLIFENKEILGSAIHIAELVLKKI